MQLVHIPTGITVTSTDWRTQQQNQRDALNKLNVILQEKSILAKQKQVNSAWREHNKIIRGNPVIVYSGMGFI